VPADATFCSMRSTATSLATSLVAALLVTACGSSVERTEDGTGSGGGGGAASVGNGSRGGNGANGPSGTGTGDVSSSADSASAADSASSADSSSAAESVSSSGSGIEPCRSAAAGFYYASFSITLANDKPLFFNAVIEGEGDDLSLTLTALRTPYREDFENEDIPVLAPVGEEIRLESFSVNPEGDLRAETGSFRVEGAANPFSPNDIVAQLSLEGSGCPGSGDPTAFCGTLSGEVTSPIVLELDPEQNFFAFEATPPPGHYDCAGSQPEEF
jgi:hypothetical protein